MTFSRRCRQSWPRLSVSGIASVCLGAVHVAVHTRIKLVHHIRIVWASSLVAVAATWCSRDASNASGAVIAVPLRAEAGCASAMAGVGGVANT